MPWNLPTINAGDYWATVNPDILNQFYDALLERQRHGTTLSFPRLAVGDEVFPFIHKLQETLESMIDKPVGSHASNLVRQTWIKPGSFDLSQINWEYTEFEPPWGTLGVGKQFVDPRAQYYYVIPCEWWQFENWRAYCNIPADGFTRLYPREIETLADTYDGQQVGDLARYAHIFGGGSQGDGRVYRWNGTTWELASPTDRPDILTGYGRMVFGDYFGPHIIAELQAGINALTEQVEWNQGPQQLIYFLQGTSALPFSSNQNSKTAVTNALNANLASIIANIPDSERTGYGINGYERHSRSRFSGKWSGELIRGDLYAPLRSVTNNLNMLAAIWLYAGRRYQVNPSNLWTYEDFGMGLPKDNFGKWIESAPIHDPWAFEEGSVEYRTDLRSCLNVNATGLVSHGYQVGFTDSFGDNRLGETGDAVYLHYTHTFDYS